MLHDPVVCLIPGHRWCASRNSTNQRASFTQQLRGKKESLREVKPREGLKFVIVILRFSLLRIVEEYFFLLAVELFGQFQALFMC